MNKPIIALLYDFDKTLSPRDMQEYGFIEGIGMTPEAFWGKCEEMSKRAEVDSILAYMYNMLREAEGKMLLTRSTFNGLAKASSCFPACKAGLRASMLTRLLRALSQSIIFFLPA